MGKTCKEVCINFQGTGCSGANKGRGDGSRVGQQIWSSPQFSWEDRLLHWFLRQEYVVGIQDD